jgi:predicted ATPase
MRSDLPAGTVTFLFTDVEGSTTLLHELGAEAYAEALAEHRRVIREACVAEGGVEVDTQGDAFFFAFPTAPGALAAASAFTETLASGPIQVRVGLHTGQPLVTGEGYVGDDVHFAARVAATSHGGQVVLSAATADLLELELTDLGEHRLKDIEQAVPIFQLGDGSFPPLKTISNTNLPRPASSFLGREAELRVVLSRIEAGARLVTLTGPGGTGKTRLAIEAAATLVPAYKAGVFWVGLASVRDPALVTETIAQTLGAKDGLAAHVGERELLLLLDNLEQVVGCAPELSALLESCPNLTLLVTSRELLRVQGEVEYPVPPLATQEAVDLFCVRSGLAPSEEIAELCARLDSLPLAVELAAARTKVLTPAQILERLASRLDLLRGGRDADPRQQTLRATIEWSYELLGPEEQELFARLSVFAGGSTLEAAEQVAGAELDILQSLVEKSLLRFTEGRYWMLETIREYAGERLAEADHTTLLRGAHAERYCTFAVDLMPSLENRPGEVVEALTGERENMRAALEYALERDDATLAADLMHGLWTFWLMTGSTEEAGSWARRYLASGRDGVPPLRRMHGDHGAGEILRFTGDNDGAAALKRELIAVARANPDAVLHGRSALRVLAANLGDLTHIELDRDRPSAAQACAEEALAVRRQIGQPGGVAHALHALSAVAYHRGDYERARALSAEAAAEAEVAGNALGAALCRVDVAECDLLLGDPESAAETLSTIVSGLSDLPDQNVEINVVRVAGMVAAADGEARRAAVLFGAADAKLQELGMALFGPAAQEIYRSYVERVRTQLGDDGFDRAYDEGIALREESALAIVSPPLD